MGAVLVKPHSLDPKSPQQPAPEADATTSGLRVEGLGVWVFFQKNVPFSSRRA